eukprot:TRINITY_DN1167_c1_g2_i5.p1 TRINITY_DN1167_c1_g2~~TRINITY_DN1167_c1_g2_i5.p1  ORF type:complete len:424 (+),score=56.33 TRINITY_DN1167_c1_g2_i5:1154-2425(+)
MNDPNIQTQLSTDGILLAVIDMPGRSMNVFSAGLMDSLEALLDRVDNDTAIRGVVLTSGKSAFVAGADLDMIRMFAERARDGSAQELHELFGRLGRLFRRLELSSKPYVAAINGLALGGGLEVCLACHARVIADDRTAQVGLPEIKLGLLPGAGGTQRLPRLIGTAKGLEMLLSGEPISPQDALQLGLVDEVVEKDSLVEAATRRALQLRAPKARWDEPGFSPSPAPFDFTRSESAFTAISESLGITEYQLKYYPAYRAIMDCVVGGWSLPMTEASSREMDIFVKLMQDPVAGNMVRTLFLNRQKAAKAGLLSATSVFSRDDDALLPRISRVQQSSEELGLSEEERVLAIALAALRAKIVGKVDDEELADVAVVVAGFSPSYTGGPFTYLRQHRATTICLWADKAASKAPELFKVPPQIALYA